MTDCAWASLGIQRGDGWALVCVQCGATFDEPGVLARMKRGTTTSVCSATCKAAAEQSGESGPAEEASE